MALETEAEGAIEAYDDSRGLLPNSNPNPNPISRRSSEPWVEVHLFRRGRGPAAIYRSGLGGPHGDRLEVRRILQENNLRSLFAFKPPNERGFRIRYSPADGTSFLPYRAGAVILVDGEPKDSLAKPVGKILMALAVPALLLVILLKEIPESLKGSRLVGRLFPPWLLVCMLMLYAYQRNTQRMS